MRDHSLELAKIAAGIITDVMGGKLICRTDYSVDGNFIIMEFDGYPIYHSMHRGKVFVQFPRSTFYIRRGNMYFEPVQQAQCRYYQEYPGNPFAHPHVYSDGHPCWDNSKRERAVDFICNVIETLSLQNVTQTSVTVGLCASGVMGVNMTALENAQKQQKKVQRELGYRPLISDRKKLEGYVDRCWRSKLTIYMKAALGG